MSKCSLKIKLLEKWQSSVYRTCLENKHTQKVSGVQIPLSPQSKLYWSNDKLATSRVCKTPVIRLCGFNSLCSNNKINMQVWCNGSHEGFKPL